MLRQVIAVVALVSCTVGCSSAYIPQPGPRVSVVMDSGSLAYVRDGKRYEGGIFGGEIEEAVRGNARAEEYARDYKNGLTTGFALSILGVGGMIGGSVVGVAGANRGSDNSALTGVAIIGAGAVLDLVGAFITIAALPHLYDAVNAYNDGLGHAADPPAPATAP